MHLIRDPASNGANVFRVFEDSRGAAAEIGVSVNTIAFHLRNIYDKWQVHSKSEAVAKALRGGLVR
jgi:FixJ family two-component response regulator